MNITMTAGQFNEYVKGKDVIALDVDEYNAVILKLENGTELKISAQFHIGEFNGLDVEIVNDRTWLFT